jgi:hypothetical protein
MKPFEEQIRSKAFEIIGRDGLRRNQAIELSDALRIMRKAIEVAYCNGHERGWDAAHGELGPKLKDYVKLQMHGTKRGKGKGS